VTPPVATTPPIDPRLRARRQEVARGRARKRLRRVAVVVAVLGVGAAGYGLAHSPLLDVDAVHLEGAVGGRANAVASAADVEPGTAMVALDPGAVARRVEGLAWVESASVRRDWPGTVVVAVTPREPVARHRNGQVLDASGRFLGAPDPAADPLPEAVVPPGEPGSVLAPEHRTVGVVLAAVPPSLVDAVASARVVDGEVVLTLTDGIRVRFGGPQRASAKFVALGALLDQADRATIATIDVRVPTSPSLTRTSGSGA
jgi:cell division protein FtsQ